MKRSKTGVLLSGALLAAGIWAGSALAERALASSWSYGGPVQKADMKQGGGEIDGVYLKRRQLVVGDVTYSLSRTVKVHNSGGALRLEAVQGLRASDRIRFNWVPSANGGFPQIVEIWILE